HFVPSMLEVFLPNVEVGECPSLRKVFCSGEALKPGHVTDFRQLFPEVELHNLYGPTEAAIEVSHWEAPRTTEDLHLVPIGKPVANTRLYILNQYGEPCPVGVPGELYIAGVQVAEGYYRRPELTQEKFVADHVRPEVNTKMYRTGDLVSWAPDGNIDYLGRIDHQVKIRGLRIELGEIEAVLQDVRGVKQSVVLAQENGNGKRLVAYVVCEGTYDKVYIQECLKAKLPEYMVPSIIMPLAEMPLTPNGKINRSALPNPDASTLVSSEYVAAQNESQKQCVAIWKALLNVEKVGIHDNFFELGGDSIIAIQLVRQLKKRGHQILPKEVFAYPTIAEMEQVLLKKSNQIIADQRYLTGPAHLLPIQQWFFEQEATAYQYFNQAILLEVDRGLSTKALEVAIKAIVDHHDALRFVYTPGEEGWQ
ncbi:MAG: AMP-binding protein, partial [Bacteroidota bacterium]